MPSNTAVVPLSPEARADLFCQNLGHLGPLLGERQSKWKSLALYIETKLPQLDKQKIYYLDRSVTGEFRSIKYDSQNKSIYIVLFGKDLPSSLRYMSFKNPPVLFYDPYAPKLIIFKSSEEELIDKIVSSESWGIRIPKKSKHVETTPKLPEGWQFDTPPIESSMEEAD